MPWKSTLENLYPNKSLSEKKAGQDIISPEPQTIQNLLAYSKALNVFESSLNKGKKRITFRLILN